MSDVAIRVEALSKGYRLGQLQRYKALRDTLATAINAPLKCAASLFNGNNGGHEQVENFIWALKDVSFEIHEGDVVGIIGRNGAGKSTLLKILSRIVEPTSGGARIRGRVGSLLEVGTGFHPELTGRENIYLNGGILGMRKKEINGKFDKIVAFAGVEQFIDTPVKYYSSGMYVRLAFSVAAHLEPEILMVDEVLAVGDAEFQKKCLGKMGEVASVGRTVLLVSHQMNSIRKLCGQCIWLNAGRIQQAGPTLEVISAYEHALAAASLGDKDRLESTHEPAQFLSWDIVDAKEPMSNVLTTLGSVTVRFLVRVNQRVENGHHGVALWDMDRRLVWANAADNLKLEPGVHEFLHTLPMLPLRPALYQWRVSLYDGTSLLDVWDCIPELIVGTQPMTHPRDEWTGILNMPCEFRIARPT